MTFFEDVGRDVDAIADDPLDRPAAAVDFGLDVLDDERRVGFKWRERDGGPFPGRQERPGRSLAVGPGSATPQLAIAATRRLARARVSFSGARVHAAAVRRS